MLQHSCECLAAHCLLDPGVRRTGVVVIPIPEGGARLGMHCTVRQAIEHQLVLSAKPADSQTMC